MAKNDTSAVGKESGGGQQAHRPASDRNGDHESKESGRLPVTNAGKPPLTRLPMSTRSTSSLASRDGVTRIAEKNIKKCDYLEFIVSLQRCNDHWLPQFDDDSVPKPDHDAQA